ncbi:MAG: PDZ domain-containing protein [Actinobacteria bacterium]|nr:MAG: PDZ domain-containing protein [Actinomycetota bacterium]
MATERAIEEGLSRQADITLTHPRLHASLEAMHDQAGIQRQDLENYLGQEAPEPTEPQSALARLLAEAASSMNLSSLLPAYCAAFSFAANEYSVLIALTLHLYDPALRELARKHLSSYAKAARLLTHLLPGAIVEELDRQGLECRCICPMCSIGACGCAAAARLWTHEAWHEAQPQLDSEPGLEIWPPRQGSQLALAGVHGGDRLLGVDDQSITTFRDVQKAIRQHQVGEEMVFRVRRGSEPRRDIQVRHVSDYPPG